MQTFLSDLQKHKLEYEERDDRVGVKGLPVLRSGVWKGIPFTPARLAEIASSFADIKRADDWMPPVRPRHPSQAEWDDGTWDTTQNLGVVEGLRYEPEADILFADIEVDVGTGEKIRGGNVRYDSAEFADYRSPNTGALYENAFRGVAFVDNPAVKNIGWLSALNAEEFEESEPIEDQKVVPQTTATREGGTKNMTIWKKFKAVVGLTDEQVDKLDTLEAAEVDQVPDDDIIAAPDATAASAEKPVDIPPEIAEQLAAAKERADAAEKRADASEKVQLAEVALRKTAEREQVLDALSADATVTPAVRDLLRPVFEALEASGENVIVLKAEEGDGDVEVTPVQLLVEALKQNAGITARYFKLESAPAGDGEISPWSEESYPAKDAKPASE